jgi:hypothetical protein
MGCSMGRQYFDSITKKNYLALYYDKPVTKIMDSSPLVVEGDTPLAIAADMAMSREKTHNNLENQWK